MNLKILCSGRTEFSTRKLQYTHKCFLFARKITFEFWGNLRQFFRLVWKWTELYKISHDKWFDIIPPSPSTPNLKNVEKIRNKYFMSKGNLISNIFCSYKLLIGTPPTHHAELFSSKNEYNPFMMSPQTKFWVIPPPPFPHPSKCKFILFR